MHYRNSGLNRLRRNFTKYRFQLLVKQFFRSKSRKVNHQNSLCSFKKRKPIILKSSNIIGLNQNRGNALEKAYYGSEKPITFNLTGFCHMSCAENNKK